MGLPVFLSNFDLFEGSFTLNVNQQKTIFDSCCISGRNASNANSFNCATCGFRPYAGMITVANTYDPTAPDDSRENSADIIVTLFYLGNVVQLDCYSGPIIIEPGECRTILVSSPFDRATVKLATFTGVNITEDLATGQYSVALAVSTGV